MSINKFNSEGYYDPTTYEALTNIEKEERALRAIRCFRSSSMTPIQRSVSWGCSLETPS